MTDAFAVLKRVREDINWMLNSRQFLNADVFDYLDEVIAQGERPPAEDLDVQQIADRVRSICHEKGYAAPSNLIEFGVAVWCVATAATLREQGAARVAAEESLERCRNALLAAESEIIAAEARANAMLEALKEVMRFLNGDEFDDREYGAMLVAARAAIAAPKGAER